MVCGTGVAFVRLLPDRQMIRIFAEITIGVTDLERAAFEVGVLNRDNPGVKFSLRDDRILAERHLLGAPFVPSALRHTLAMMCELTERTDRDLAHRVAGHTFIGAPPVLSTMPPAVRALLNLEKVKPGLLTPAASRRGLRLRRGADPSAGGGARPWSSRADSAYSEKVLRKALKIVQ